jgi:hypothetical protein
MRRAVFGPSFGVLLQFVKTYIIFGGMPLDISISIHISYIHLSSYPSIHLYLSIHLSVVYISIHVSLWIYIYIFMTQKASFYWKPANNEKKENNIYIIYLNLSIIICLYPSIYIYLPIYPSIYLPIHPSIYLSTYLSIYQYIYIYIYLYISQTIHTIYTYLEPCFTYP